MVGESCGLSERFRHLQRGAVDHQAGRVPVAAVIDEDHVRDESDVAVVRSHVVHMGTACVNEPVGSCCGRSTQNTDTQMSEIHQ